MRRILTITASLVFASAAHAESLTDALSIAYATNPTIRAERARLDATKETRAQAWAASLPQISANGSYSRSDITQTSNFSGSPQTLENKLDTLTGGVSAEHPLFAGFRNFNAIKQAGARIRAGGARLVSIEQSVLSDVASAYFNVQRTQAVFELNSKNVEVLTRQSEMATVRFDVGEITRTDVAQANARLAIAQANRSGAQAELAVARAAYAQLVGQSPGELEPVEILPDLPESLDSALAFAREYAPTTISAREQAEASRRQIQIARGALAPTVSLTAGYQYTEEASPFIDSDEQFTFGARASLPIFTGGLNLSRIREAKSLHAADRSALLEAERLVEAQVTAAWQRLIAARAIAVSARASVDANQLALEGVTQEAFLGTRTTLDVLDAEQEFLNAQVTLVNAERDAQAAAYALLAAIGLLTPEAVGVSVVSGGELSLYEG